MFAFLFIFWEFYRSLWRIVRDPAMRSVVVWLGILLTAGPVFYHRIEGWSWLDSLYFCIVTLATVGFGDLSPATSAGKMFTMVYILMGIGILVAFANALVQDAARDQKGDSPERADDTPTNA